MEPRVSKASLDRVAHQICRIHFSKSSPMQQYNSEGKPFGNATIPERKKKNSECNSVNVLQQKSYGFVLCILLYSSIVFLNFYFFYATTSLRKLYYIQVNIRLTSFNNIKNVLHHILYTVYKQNICNIAFIQSYTIALTTMQVNSMLPLMHNS